MSAAATPDRLGISTRHAYERTSRQEKAEAATVASFDKSAGASDFKATLLPVRQKFPDGLRKPYLDYLLKLRGALENPSIQYEYRFPSGDKPEQVRDGDVRALGNDPEDEGAMMLIHRNGMIVGEASLSPEPDVRTRAEEEYGYSLQLDLSLLEENQNRGVGRAIKEAASVYAKMMGYFGMHQIVCVENENHIKRLSRKESWLQLTDEKHFPSPGSHEAFIEAFSPERRAVFFKDLSIKARLSPPD